MTDQNKDAEGSESSTRSSGKPPQELLSLWSADESIVDTKKMKEIGARPPIHVYIKQLWNRRHFILPYSRGKAHGSVRGTALGSLWLIVEPFLSSAVYFFIFAVLLSFDRGMENFVGYLVVGVTMFGFLSGQFQGAASIIESGKTLIRAFAFPRATLVLSFTLRKIIDFIPTFCAMLLFISVIPPHALPTKNWLLMPLVLLLGVIFGCGLSLFTAAVTHIVPDLKFIWPVVTRFWFYGSGIFWSVDMFANKPALQELMMANPGWVFLELSRELLVYNQTPSIGLIGYFAAWAFGMLAFGFIIFWHREESFGKQDDR